MEKRLDGGYGWAVVAAHFIICAAIYGTNKMSGVLFVYFQDEFNATYAATSSIAFSQRLSETSTALICSFVAERFGSRPIMLVGSCLLVFGAFISAFAKSIQQLSFTFGVLIGLGSSMLAYPGAQMIPKYFDKKVAIASAFAFTGGSFGPLALPFVIKSSISEYGLSGSFWIIAGVYAHVFVGSMLMRPPSFFRPKIRSPSPTGKNIEKIGFANEEKKQLDGENPSFNSMLKVYKTCFQHKSLMIYFAAQVTASIAITNYIAYQQAYARDRGIRDPTLLASLTSIWGVSEIIARVIFAFVLQSGIVHPFRVFQMCSICFAAVLVVYPTIDSYWMIALFSGLVAVIWSVSVICIMPIIRAVVGIELTSAAFGLLFLPAIFAYSSVQLSGFIRDLTGTFAYVYYTCAVILLFGVVLIEIIAHRAKMSIFNKMSAFLQKCKDSKQHPPEEPDEGVKEDL